MIERSEEEINMLLENEVEFWQQYVENRIPPEPDGSESTAAAIRACRAKTAARKSVGIRMILYT